MLDKMELHRDLLRLSDLIAAEDHCLYKLFDAGKLSSLLSRLADASIRLLDSNKVVSLTHSFISFE